MSSDEYSGNGNVYPRRYVYDREYACARQRKLTLHSINVRYSTFVDNKVKRISSAVGISLIIPFLFVLVGYYLVGFDFFIPKYSYSEETINNVEYVASLDSSNPDCIMSVSKINKTYTWGTPSLESSIISRCIQSAALELRCLSSSPSESCGQLFESIKGIE